MPGAPRRSGPRADRRRGRLRGSSPTSLNPTQQQQAATLAATAEPAFDSVYINGSIAGHQHNITNNYDAELGYGKVPELLSYAHTYLPQVTMHLQMAQTIKAKYGF